RKIGPLAYHSRSASFELMRLKDFSSHSAALRQNLERSHESMSEQQRGAIPLLQEVARNAAKKVFTHPAAPIGPHHQQLGMMAARGRFPRFLGRAVPGQFVVFSRNAMAREITQGSRRRRAARLLRHGNAPDRLTSPPNPDGMTQGASRFVAAI